MENERTQTRCPKCGRDNLPDAQFCLCGCELVQRSDTGRQVSVRVSWMAVAAFSDALCGLALIMPMLVPMTGHRSRLPRSEVVGIAFMIGFVLLVVSAIMGVISFMRIERNGGRITGRSFAVASVLIAIFSLVLAFVWPIFAPVRCTAFRMVCGTNLSGIGKAMLIYSNDYDNELPRSAGRDSTWAQTIPDWTATNRFQAYGVSANGQGGVGTISSCFYLLVKYAEVTPKSFICGKSEPKARPFNPAKYGARDRDLIELWDFGPEPWKHVSYSYHMPFGQYALTTSNDPNLAVAADRNPWIDSPFVGYRKDFSKFAPDGDREAVKAGNTIGHQEDGQNILYLDSHVNFEKLSFRGVNGDNIYTFWDGEDVRRGAPPVLGSQPQDRKDSLLVHEPPATNQK